MIRALLLHDIRLQWRYGIYFAYAFVIAFYVTTLWFLGDNTPPWLPGLIIFSDPAAVGFFFLGALMLLEKSEGVRMALAISPLTARAYFWSKCATLSMMATVAILLITLVAHQGANLALLLPAVILTSIQYLALGVPIARMFNTVTAYLIGAAIILIPVVLPAYFALLDPMPNWMMLFPAAAQLKLMLLATGYGSASMAQIAAMLLVLLIAAALSVLWAIRVLEQEFGRK